ncbi:MAG TPA: SAM-dependent methyltransferase, partial [Trebonia sp.]
MTTAGSADAAREIDTSRPHSARVYDYLIGGKNHFEADREAARNILAVLPTGNTGPRENRGFLGRAVRYLAAEAGIRQFLDIGTGLPTTSNVHEVAQAAVPASRVVYVDNDPLVLVHARALLTSDPDGRTAYIEEDLRNPRAILSHPVTQAVLDFTQPVGLIIAGVLHFVVDDDKPAEIVATLVDALPSGSYLVASHISPEHSPKGTGAAQSSMRSAGIAMQTRESDEFARLAFSGLDLVPPGVVLVSEWR